jgi:hypothetical protein
LARLPKDSRAAIYEGENDVTIAKNRRDDAQATMDRLRAELDALDHRADRAKARASRGSAGNASGIGRVSDAKRAYLEAEREAAGFGRERAEAEIALARGRLERTRKAQLVRVGLLPEGDLAPYDQAERALDASLREAEKRELDKHTAALKRFEDWKRTEDEYTRATGDFDNLVWVD